MVEKKSQSSKTDSSMSVAGQQLCSDTECIGQVADNPDEDSRKDQQPSGEKQEASSSMRAGKHSCDDDQCIGKD